MDDAHIAQLEQTISDEMVRGSISGVAIALVSEGAIAWSKGYGVTHIETGEPIRPDTPFSAQSVSKTFIATALMQLRDKGSFDLDDHVNEHLAPVAIRNQWETDRPVTIRHLLTHTSGLPVTLTGGEGGKLALDEYVAANARCERPPGEAIIYANSGFDAAGILIERFSGQPVDEYLRTQVFEPLGMRSTALANPAKGTPHAVGHYLSFVDRQVRPLPIPDWPTTPPNPSGACWSTAEDLARFLVAHLTSGARVLNENTAAEMHKLHAAQGSTRSGMGLGFRVTYANGRRTICHGGDGSGFTALIGAHPDERVGVALLINTGGAQTARSVIGNTALALLAGDTPPRRQKSAPPLTTGVYRSTYWDIEIEARDGGAPTLVCTEGLLVREDPTDSRLDGTPEGRLEGVGGLFHGFEIDLEDSDPPQVMGGVYPFTFVRTGELPTGAATVDEHILLGGKWSGTVRTPLGAMVATLTVNDERSMAITTPLGVDHQIENADARSGRVEGEFSLSLPGVGEHRCFLRLAAIGGALTGKIYARGRFGEAAMPTDLTRV